MRGKINEDVESDKFKDQFEFLIENSLVGVCIIQKNKIEFANRFLLETLGYTLEELQNVNSWEIIAPEDRERIKGNKINREANIAN